MATDPTIDASDAREAAGTPALDAGTALSVRGVAKRFTLHLQGGTELPVVAGASFDARFGRCTVLDGPSGAGKSSLLRMIHGGYRIDAGRVLVRHGGSLVDVARADDRTLIRVRRDTVGHVGQFLRAVPRVAALDVVAGPLVGRGADPDAAREGAREMLARLRLPERLWGVPPATFSGGEQQRVNVARGLLAGHPILLLDEPTASLDAANRDAVIELVRERRAAGVALLGIFHDAAVREALADDVVDAAAFAGAAREPNASPRRDLA